MKRVCGSAVSNLSTHRYRKLILVLCGAVGLSLLALQGQLDRVDARKTARAQLASIGHSLTHLAGPLFNRQRSPARGRSIASQTFDKEQAFTNVTGVGTTESVVVTVSTQAGPAPGRKLALAKPSEHSDSNGSYSTPQGRATPTENVPTSKVDTNVRFKLAVGVSVAPRDPPTVLRLLDEIFNDSDVGEDLADTVLVIHVAFNVTIADKIHKAAQGRENVYVMEEKSPHWQAEPENIPDTRGETMVRTVWRTKQVMDYAVLLRALVRFNTTYILMLEDDAKPAKNAFTKVRQVASQFDNHKDFGLMSFYSPLGSAHMQMNSKQRFPGFGTGAVALMFTHFAAEKVVEMLLAKPWWYPVDLMIPPYVIQELKRGFYVHTPHLFQHVSERSTYAGEDAAKRNLLAEKWRSPAFICDAENSTSALTPFEGSGYIGCFMDHNLARQRDLICQFDLQSASSIEKCRRFCQKSYYFGLQAGGECYCGNEFGRYGRVNDSRCNIPCKSANNQNCGGNGFNSVYRLKPFSATYQGCFSGNLLTAQIQVSKKVPSSSLINCINACGGKALIGLTNGNTCHCLNLSNGTTLSDFESMKLNNGVCNIVCPAYRGYICGGASNSVVLYQTW